MGGRRGAIHPLFNPPAYGQEGHGEAVDDDPGRRIGAARRACGGGAAGCVCPHPAGPGADPAAYRDPRAPPRSGDPRGDERPGTASAGSVGGAPRQGLRRHRPIVRRGDHSPRQRRPGDDRRTAAARQIGPRMPGARFLCRFLRQAEQGRQIMRQARRIPLTRGRGMPDQGVPGAGSGSLISLFLDF